jgi:hypothetical protein
MLGDNCYITQLVREYFVSIFLVCFNHNNPADCSFSHIFVFKCGILQYIVFGAVIVSKRFLLQDLSENSIGADGGIVLAEMLMRNQILRKLTLRCKLYN